MMEVVAEYAVAVAGAYEAGVPEGKALEIAEGIPGPGGAELGAKVVEAIYAGRIKPAAAEGYGRALAIGYFGPVAVEY